MSADSWTIAVLGIVVFAAGVALVCLILIGIVLLFMRLTGGRSRRTARVVRAAAGRQPAQWSGPRSFAWVLSDLSDDAVWDENDNIISPGCRNLCQAIFAAMEPLGWTVDVFVQRNDFQWEFILKREGERYDIITHDLGGPERGFSVDNHSRRSTSREARGEAAGRFLASLHDALMADAKVRRIRWSYEFEETGDAGFDYPVDRAAV